MDIHGNVLERRELRQRVKGLGQFSINQDSFETQSIDLSENGARIQIKKPMDITIRMMVGAKEMERRAHLVWAKHGAEGKMEFGLEYIPEVEEASEPVPMEDEVDICGPLRLLW